MFACSTIIMSWAGVNKTNKIAFSKPYAPCYRDEPHKQVLPFGFCYDLPCLNISQTPKG